MPAILSGYSQEGNHGLEAIFVFIEMVGEGMGLDHVSFTSAVSACGVKLQRNHIVECFDFRVCSERAVSRCTKNILRSNYGVEAKITHLVLGGLGGSRRLLGGLGGSRRLWWVAWAGLAASFLFQMKTDEVCTRRGMWCASEMKRQRNQHDEVTVTLRALDMFCKQLQLHLSHNIDENTVTVTVCSFFWVCFVYYGFKFFDERRRLIEARNVFDEMANEDMVSWNAILSGYSQEGNHGLEAIFVFIEMVGEGMGLDHCEVTEDAKLVFQCMNDRNIVSWSTMISIDEDDAISLFNEMRLDGVYPNDVTFVGLIHAISIRKLVEEGEMIHGVLPKDWLFIKA
ncbi:unnamed protein product [Prunus brigantina]